MEQGLRARKEGLAKELRNSLGQEIKVSETIRKRLFGTLPKAESIKQSLNEPAEKSQRYKEEQISLGNEATSCSGRCTLQRT